MTSTSQKHVLSLLDKAEQTLDAVFIQANEAIKAQKELISQDIERVKRNEEMDEDEKKSLNNLYVEDYKCLMKSIQDLTQLIENGKGEIKRRSSSEIESNDLWMAAAENNVNIVKPLLKRGIADVDWQNPDESDDTALIRTSLYGYLEICKLLVKAGANADIQNFGSTAVFKASIGGNLENCKLLIKAKAKVDIQNKHSETALIASCYEGHKEVASFFLAEGASHTFKDKYGQTAGDYAVEEHGWNWNYMIAEANLCFFDHMFDCMINADRSPLVERQKGRERGERKRKGGEEEEEEKKVEELPFLLRFMKRIYFSDLMMSKYVFPKLSFNPGAEAGEGIQIQEDILQYK